MQIDLNDDQLELLVNVLSEAYGDVEFDYSELYANELHGYGGKALYQAMCRLKDLFETVKEQSGSNWVHNVSTQRMEPRYKLREG